MSTNWSDGIAEDIGHIEENIGQAQNIEQYRAAGGPNFWVKETDVKGDVKRNANIL